MTLTKRATRPLLLIATATLAACASIGLVRDAPELPPLTAGAHALVLDGDADARHGTAFVGNNGAAYVVLGDDAHHATRVIYRRSSSALPWQRVPQQGGGAVLASALDELLPVAAWTMPHTATPYRTRIGEQTVAFTLSPDGQLAATGDGCRLSGAAGVADLAGAARVTVRFSGCQTGGGPADDHYNGIAYVDPDAPEAAFRVIVDNGSIVQDFYAYAD